MLLIFCICCKAHYFLFVFRTGKLFSLLRHVGEKTFVVVVVVVVVVVDVVVVAVVVVVSCCCHEVTEDNIRASRCLSCLKRKRNAKERGNNFYRK